MEIVMACVDGTCFKGNYALVFCVCTRRAPRFGDYHQSVSQDYLEVVTLEKMAAPLEPGSLTQCK